MILKSPVAYSVPFNKETSDLISTDVNAAILEINNKVLTSASPGFSFGRSGSVTGNTYLQCETVPSNVAGRWVYINSAEVRRVFVSNELSTTFTLDVLYHDGNGVNLTSLGSVTVVNSTGDSFSVAWAVPSDKQLAVRVSPSTANTPKNVVCGLELAGTL